MIDLQMPEPKFQQRTAIIALRYMAYSLGYLAEGNAAAAATWQKCALLYVELAKTKTTSPIVQGALNALPFDVVTPADDQETT